MAAASVSAMRMTMRVWYAVPTCPSPPRWWKVGSLVGAVDVCDANQITDWAFNAGNPEAPSSSMCCSMASSSRHHRLRLSQGFAAGRVRARQCRVRDHADQGENSGCRPAPPGSSPPPRWRAAARDGGPTPECLSGPLAASSVPSELIHSPSQGLWIVSPETSPFLGQLWKDRGN